jgi:peptidoglycan/LPS O-acetylase OafA/YrhL
MSLEASRPREIRQLTGLRGVLALDVALGHLESSYIPVVDLFVFHNAAVDIFFCLSSFVLCLAYGAGTGRKLDVRAYAVARIARIYPLYAASTLLLLGLERAWQFGPAAGVKTGKVLRQLLHQMLMLGALPIESLAGFWNSPAWSLAVEAWCYVTLFPLFFFACRPALKLPAQLIAACVVLAGFASLAMFTWHANTLVLLVSYPWPADPYAGWVASVRGATLFTAGWLIYLLYAGSAPIRQAAGLLTDAMAVLFVLLVMGGSSGLTSRQAVVVLAPFLILGLTDGRSVTARLLASRPVHALGLISYSLYLLHQPVTIMLFHWLPGLQRSDALRISVSLLATVAVATGSYLWIEVPARNGLRRLLGRAPRDTYSAASG